MPTKVDKDLGDSSSALTREVVTNYTLELVGGTFFLGDPSLGSKLFIYACCEKLAEQIFDFNAASIAPPKLSARGRPELAYPFFVSILCTDCAA